MSETPLSSWQAQFFSERVRAQSSGSDGVYFREQVFGALDVLSDALPDLQSALGEQNFRFFVRELLQNAQPRDALGTSLVEPFLSFLLNRPELKDHSSELTLVRTTLERVRANSAPP
jgi:hypothetical protein